MKYYKKFKILQALESEVGMGAIFYPENATKEYGISFMEDKFKFGRDYVIDYRAIILGDGARPYEPTANFTKKGVKKLLKISPQARKVIDDLWGHWIRDVEAD